MEEKLKLFHAMIWREEPDVPGERVSVNDKSLDEAEKILETKYGEGTVFNLHNEEDANAPR